METNNHPKEGCDPKEESVVALVDQLEVEMVATMEEIENLRKDSKNQTKEINIVNNKLKEAREMEEELNNNTFRKGRRNQGYLRTIEENKLC